jgi:hypothetical protein
VKRECEENTLALHTQTHTVIAEREGFEPPEV